MDAQTASEVANATFYFAGAGAVVIGAALAARRFFFERPYQPIWEVSIEECRLRRLGTRYHYGALIVIWNRSKSWQSVTRCWAKPFLGDDWSLLPETPFRSTLEAEAFFGETGLIVEREIGPDESFCFGKGIAVDSMEHVLRLCYAFEFRAKHTVWPGYHKKGLRFAAGSRFVPVNLDDLNFYEEAKLEAERARP